MELPASPVSPGSQNQHSNQQKHQSEPDQVQGGRAVAVQALPVSVGTRQGVRLPWTTQTGGETPMLLAICRSFPGAAHSYVLLTGRI